MQPDELMVLIGGEVFRGVSRIKSDEASTIYDVARPGSLALSSS